MDKKDNNTNKTNENNSGFEIVEEPEKDTTLFQCLDK